MRRAACHLVEGACYMTLPHELASAQSCVPHMHSSESQAEALDKVHWKSDKVNF